MFSPSELAAMTREIEGSIGPESGLGSEIVLHRGTARLAAQPVRLVRPSGQSRTAGGAGTESEQADVEVVGAPGLDIRPRDRFAMEGNAYEVLSVHPQRQINTVAVARVVQ